MGDSALVVEFGTIIDAAVNREVIARATQLTRIKGVTEVVPCYSSLTIHFDPIHIRKENPGARTAFEAIKRNIETLLAHPFEQEEVVSGRVVIPVCYDCEFAPDLDNLSTSVSRSREEVISLHASTTYRVFMLGFLPGFCYLGEVDERIAVPRKPLPQPVAAGSIGIAGRQTGVYPLASPGGWHIIGRTPLSIFTGDEDKPVVLKPGDEVRFMPISKEEFIDFNKDLHWTRHHKREP